MKSGNLNFLEPSGPLQACKRTALPLVVVAVEVLADFPNPETHLKKKIIGVRAFRNCIVIASPVLHRNTHIIVAW